uniref:BTSP n=1 Tax=Argas monolakensis TaxID=34602 RepID=Q09JX6_ARGMO|nr:BTSP [Argas monolakensis]
MKPMSAVKALLTFALLVAVTDADIEGLKKTCPDKDQPAGDAGCMYYCDDKGNHYGIYPDGSTCDYTGSRDGKCQDGLCYPGPNSVTPTAVP